MRLALSLARRAYGATSPNPMVGAVLLKNGRIIGRGWHHRAGLPHAEIEALNDARERGANPKGATLYVTLEPCSTQGRTPPCTDAILSAGIRRVVAGATDPNPRHSGRAFHILRHAGLAVTPGVLAADCERLNEAFNHWIVHRTPFVTVKAAMTLDGKIATARGESKWITGPEARDFGMKLRAGSDAILVGINTVLADDPSLTVRPAGNHRLRRLILDSMARTTLSAKVVSAPQAELTTIVVSELAPKKRVAALARHVHVLVAPFAGAEPGMQGSRLRSSHSSLSGLFHKYADVGGEEFFVQARREHRAYPRRSVRCEQRCLREKEPPNTLPDLGNRPLSLPWLLKQLGAEAVTSLLVEGGGEVNASFLMQGLAHRIAFFYAPKILGGRDARRAVAGEGANTLREALNLTALEWRWFGPDLFLTARVL